MLFAPGCISVVPFSGSDMNNAISTDHLAETGAAAIYESFDGYHRRFKAITLRAGERFLKREWSRVQKDAAQRLGLYRAHIGEIETAIRQLLADSVMDHTIWTAMKSAYSCLIRCRNDWEIAETYFNSVTRRIFFTVGVDPRIEFVNSDFDTPPSPAENNVYRRYLSTDGSTDTADLFLTILKDSQVGEKMQNPDRWAARVAARIQQQLEAARGFGPVEHIDIACSIFYRSKAAYLLGRIKTTHGLLPLAVALHHPAQGVEIDAVLLNEDSLSILFSFTRSYFLACTDRPYDLVRFLKSILPHKRIAEIYNSIGYNKHGKTELYRDIVSFTRECSNEQFTLSPGKRGMVMIVFNMAHDDLVIKLIRDRFSSPKNTIRNWFSVRYKSVRALPSLV